jgi:hypothetical protein
MKSFVPLAAREHFSAWDALFSTPTQHKTLARTYRRNISGELSPARKRESELRCNTSRTGAQTIAT